MSGNGSKFDDGKPMYNLVSPFAHEQLARVLTNGAVKYGAENWKQGIAFSRIIAACERHLAAIKRGEDYDIGPKGDGLLHSAHLMCEAMFLTEFYKIFPQGDDRAIDALKAYRIGLDIDDVLADFCGEYCKRYGLERPKTWTFDPLFAERYAELCNDESFFLDMPALESMDKLRFEPVCYITSRACPKEWTERWLAKNGFPPAPVYCPGPDSSKVDIAKAERLDIFVDDRFDNFAELTKAGVFTYLYSQPHNARYNVGHRRINSLAELF